MRDMTNQYEARISINGNNSVTPVDEYYHSDGNTYFEARQGSEFTIQLNNHSSERVVMIPAIDGLCTIDGQPAGLNSPGFVVEPWSSVNVPGWSKSEHSAAHFVFWDKENSYSNKTGRGKENVGVIGILVFREKQLQNLFGSSPNMSTFVIPPSNLQVWNNNQQGGCQQGSWGIGDIGICNIVDTHNSATATSSATASASASPYRSTRGTRRITPSGVNLQEAGTGHGRITNFNTTQVDFDKRDPQHPDSQIVMYYDTSRGLERRGIVLKYKQNYAPDPFPSSPGYYSNTRKG